jgi:hypothetical protein
VKATPSLPVSLAAKPNDHFTLIFPTRDSVIFSTGRHKFDIFLNRKEKPVRQQQILRLFSYVVDRGGYQQWLKYPAIFWGPQAPVAAL